MKLLLGNGEVVGLWPFYAPRIEQWDGVLRQPNRNGDPPYVNVLVYICHAVECPVNPCSCGGRKLIEDLAAEDRTAICQTNGGAQA